MGRWRARPLQGILKIASWQLALDGLERLAGPKPSGQAGPIPVTRWGAAQQGHHHVVRVLLGQLQKALVQMVLGRLFCVGHEPLVDALQDVRCLEEKCLRVGLLPEQSLSRGPLTSASLPTTQCWPKRVSHAQRQSFKRGTRSPKGLSPTSRILTCFERTTLPTTRSSSLTAMASCSCFWSLSCCCCCSCSVWSQPGFGEDQAQTELRVCGRGWRTQPRPHCPGRVIPEPGTSGGTEPNLSCACVGARCSPADGAC